MKLSSYPGLWYVDILYQFCGTLMWVATVSNEFGVWQRFVRSRAI
jgi:hypothetical protein